MKPWRVFDVLFTFIKRDTAFIVTKWRVAESNKKEYATVETILARRKTSFLTRMYQKTLHAKSL